MKKFLFSTPITDPTISIGLLIHRIVFGGFMLVGHGWGKLQGLLNDPTKFPDPLGIGAVPSMIGAVASEVLFAAMIVVGLGTRAAALPLVFTMLTAAFLVHGSDPLFMGGGASKEPALIYLAGYLLLLFTGAGRYSLDSMIGKGR